MILRASNNVAALKRVVLYRSFSFKRTPQIITITTGPAPTPVGGDFIPTFRPRRRGR